MVLAHFSRAVKEFRQFLHEGVVVYSPVLRRLLRLPICHLVSHYSYVAWYPSYREAESSMFLLYRFEVFVEQIYEVLCFARSPLADCPDRCLVIQSYRNVLDSPLIPDQFQSRHYSHDLRFEDRVFRRFPKVYLGCRDSRFPWVLEYCCGSHSPLVV